MKLRFDLKIFSALVWLVFTLALAVWWLVFGLRQVTELKTLPHANAEKLAKNQRMLLWEGSILVVLLAGGGATLLYYIQLEKKRSRELRQFLATFSHEVKTSIASLRLQTESLAEDLPSSDILKRLLKDSVRLELQFENSLFLAQEGSFHLHPEPLSLSELKEHWQQQWTDLKIVCDGKGKLRVDRRALDAVVKNLFQNAVVHGKAKSIRLVLSRSEVREGEVVLEIKDDGMGMAGDLSRLGELFYRPSTRSGSGLGLHIVTKMVHRMGGRVEYTSSEAGFCCRMWLPGEVT